MKKNHQKELEDNCGNENYYNGDQTFDITILDYINRL